MIFKYKAQHMKTGVIQDGEVHVFKDHDEDAEFGFLATLDRWNRRSETFKYWSDEEGLS